LGYVVVDEKIGNIENIELECEVEWTELAQYLIL
jgi:hypothetical protein